MIKKLPILFIVGGVLLIMSVFTHNQIQSTPELLKQITPTQSIQPTPQPQLTGRTVLGEKNLEEATISAVVDGDTIKLTDGRTLRYIGVDTPETVDPRRPVQCFGKEASDYNKMLVTGKTVYLEKDVSDTDRFGRLLRYVYLQSGEMVNEMLVRDGYAQSSAYPPDIKYQEKFDQFERQARDNELGLWGSCVQTNTQEPITTNQYSCDCSKTCTTITTCSEATFQLQQCGCTGLDGNNDGVACNSLCR